jgi:hypothetical protein
MNHYYCKTHDPYFHNVGCRGYRREGVNENQNTYQQFWVVWNSGSKTPTRKHYIQSEAESEAIRLSKENPTCEFFVLSSQCSYQSPPSNVIRREPNREPY